MTYYSEAEIKRIRFKKTVLNSGRDSSKAFDSDKTAQKAIQKPGGMAVGTKHHIPAERFSTIENPSEQEMKIRRSGPVKTGPELLEQVMREKGLR